MRRNQEERAPFPNLFLLRERLRKNLLIPSSGESTERVWGGVGVGRDGLDLYNENSRRRRLSRDSEVGCPRPVRV